MGSGRITLEPGTRAYYARCGEYEPIVIDGTYENEEGNYGYLYICTRTGNRSRCHHSWIVLTLEEAIARTKLWIEQQR